MSKKRETLLNMPDLETEQFVESLIEVMKTVHGRRVMWRLLSICRIFVPCFTGSSETFYNEGRREVGLELLHFVSHYCRKEYRRMEDEAYNDQKRNLRDG